MSNADYTDYPAGGFAPMMLLAAPLGFVDETLTFTSPNEPYPESIQAGMALMVDEEIMLVAELGTGTMTVRRGCADTVPATHAAGAKIWVITEETQSDNRVYAAEQTIGVKVLPYIPAGARLEMERAEAFPLTFNYRFARPYPPAQMRKNTARWFTSMELSSNEPTLGLTWVDRNRITQADQLVGHDEANITPEDGTTYTMRVYDHTNTLVRTEVGIGGHAFNYTWAQAINDFGVGTDPEGEQFPGRIEFESNRDSFASWQRYHIPFTLNNLNAFMFVAQASEQTASTSDETALMRGMYVGQVSEQTAETNSEPNQHIMLTAQVSESAGQLTSFATPLTRKLFEAAYTYLLKKGQDPNANRVMTATARPSDRLTDSHKLYGRSHESNPFTLRDSPVFTPWLLIDEPMEPLQVVVAYKTTSLTDGVPLSSVLVGQLALLGAEIVRVDAINATHITLGRGCVDTVPASQQKDERLWFIGAAGGVDMNLMTYHEDDVVENKLVPDVYGPPLDLELIPTDKTTIASRYYRPFPPGQMRANGQPWYLGATATPEQGIHLTWVQRNRLTQADAVISHDGPDIIHEDRTGYRITIIIQVYNAVKKKREPVTIREAWVNGREFVYTYAMAQADGARAAQLLEVCGYVVVPMYVDAVRDGYSNWQGYSIPLTLPAPACPPSKPPGGGQGPSNPNTPGGGNGSGGNPGVPGSPSDPNPPSNPNPPTWPPIPPDPPEPGDPGEPDPGDTDPDPGDTGEHWDFTWDIHWDAYRRVGDDDTGEG